MTNAQRNSKDQHAFMMRAISDQQIGHDPLPHIIYTTKHRPTCTPEIHGGTEQIDHSHPFHSFVWLFPGCAVEPRTFIPSKRSDIFITRHDTCDIRPMSAHKMHQSIESLSLLLRSKRNGRCPLDWPGMGWTIAPRCTRDCWADTSHSPHQNDHRN